MAVADDTPAPADSARQDSAPMGRPAAGAPAAAAMITAPARMIADDRVEITGAWVRILSAPEFGSSALEVAYGNDTLTVLRVQGAWAEVQLGPNRTGWVSLVDPPKKTEAASEQ